MSPVALAIMRRIGRLHARLYRLSGGRIGHRMGGVECLLLTTTGRRTGARRTAPLLYVAEPATPGVVYLVASQGGAPVHPAWYHNLSAHPDVEVQIGPDVRRMKADTLDDGERARVWPMMTAAWPDYDAYQASTTRRIPVVRLTPAPAP